ncbi:hypothetical protein FRX31_003845, partial [Thalictrum thalictroides]
LFGRCSLFLSGHSNLGRARRSTSLSSHLERYGESAAAVKYPCHLNMAACLLKIAIKQCNIVSLWGSLLSSLVS